jgi:hypothetical protein
LGKCDRQAFAVAAIRSRSARIDGPITSGCPIWKPVRLPNVRTKGSGRAAGLPRSGRWGYPANALVGPFRRTDTVAARRQLVTLQDAGNYITKLPKAEHEAAGG